MAMTVIWTGMTALSLLCALAMGNQGELASAALDGAASAIELGISMAGVLCLWMGVMEVMQRAGLAEKLARLLRPILRRLFPDFAGDRGTMDTIAALNFGLVIATTLGTFGLEKKKDRIHYTVLAGAAAGTILAAVYAMLTYMGMCSSGVYPIQENVDAQTYRLSALWRTGRDFARGYFYAGVPDDLRGFD